MSVFYLDVQAWTQTLKKKDNLAFLLCHRPQGSVSPPSLSVECELRLLSPTAPVRHL